MRKKIAVVALVCIMVLAVSGPALATDDIEPVLGEEQLREIAEEVAAIEENSKAEVIYANLDAGGAVQTVNIVNVFQLTGAGAVVDYGEYAAVKNLTDTEAITHKQDRVEFESAGGNFYYQGTLAKNDLPWNFTVAYELDGEQIAPQDLAGQAGHLTIRIHSEQNEAINPAFFDCYMLQVSVTLNSEKCRNISSNGTVAWAGKDVMTTFTVMPGGDGEITLSADVSAFSMAGIDIAAVPFSMPVDVDIDGMTGQLVLLSDAISQLNSGVAQLKNGTTTYAAGMDQLAAGGTELVNGSAQIKQGVNAIADLFGGSFEGMDIDFDWSSLDQLPDLMDQLAAAFNEIAAGVAGLKTSLQTVDSAMNAIPSGAIAAEDLAPLYESNPELATVLDELYAGYSAGQNAKAVYDAEKPAIDQALASVDLLTSQYSALAQGITEIAALLRSEIESGELSRMISEFIDGAAQLSEGYNQFHAGLVEYTNGVAAAASGFRELDAGVAELYSGTGQLHAGVSRLPQQIELQMGDFASLLDSGDFEPVSFASAKNESVSTVQFVLKLGGIELPGGENTAEQQQQELTFIDRFLALFAKQD